MPRKSHGTGEFSVADFANCGTGCVFEPGVLVFHPENIHIGDNVYVGHRAMLKGYMRNAMRIASGVWIGQNCYFHSAGGISIGANVGVGPGVQILTSSHREVGRSLPILHSPIEFAPVVIEADADIGVGSIILPGVRVGRGVQVGAGSVVTRDVPPYSVVAGSPARILRERTEG